MKNHPDTKARQNTYITPDKAIFQLGFNCRAKANKAVNLARMGYPASPGQGRILQDTKATNGSSSLCDLAQSCERWAKIVCEGCGHCNLSTGQTFSLEAYWIFLVAKEMPFTHSQWKMFSRCLIQLHLFHFYAFHQHALGQLIGYCAIRAQIRLWDKLRQGDKYHKNTNNSLKNI